MGVSGRGCIECRFFSEDVAVEIAQALRPLAEWPPRLDPLNDYLSRFGLGRPIRGGEHGDFPLSMGVEQPDARTIRCYASCDNVSNVDNLFDELRPAFVGLGSERIYQVSESGSEFVSFFSRNAVGQVNQYETCWGEGRLDEQLFHIIRNEDGWTLDAFLEIEEIRDPSKRPDDGIEVFEADAPFKGLPKAGKTAVRVSVWREDSLYGFVDASGCVITEPIYPRALPYCEGLAAIKGDSGFEYIDRAGNKAFDRVFDYVGCFSRGFAAVMAKDEGGRLRSLLVDRKGNTKLDIGTAKSFNLSWDYLGASRLRVSQSSLHDGLAPFSARDESMGYMDVAGNIVIEPRFRMCDNFREGVGCVEFGAKKTALDTQGHTIVEGQFDLLSGAQGGMIIGRKPGRTSYFDKAGQLIFELPHPGGGDYGEFHERMAVICLPNPREGGVGRGLVHDTGKIVLEPVFHSISPFQAGIAVACYRGTWGLLNADLAFRRFPPEVQSNDYKYDVTNVPGVLHVYADDGKRQGIADLDGRVIYMPPR
jgi:hypothetical protein